MKYEFKMSISKLMRVVGRSAHGIHFTGERYVKYRNTCLTLFGQEYDGLERIVDDSWNPFRLPRA